MFCMSRQKNPAFLNPPGKTLPCLLLPGWRAWEGNPVTSARPKAHTTVELHSWVRKMGFLSSRTVFAIKEGEMGQGTWK